MSAEEIESEINKLERESKAFRYEALKMTWYMRGGVSYSEAMSMSLDDRKMVGDIVKDNLETTKKSGLNFF